MVRHLVYALIYALLPLCSKDVERISETTNSFAIISPALAFITQNYNQEIRVSDLAGRCNLSETYFRTLFKTITGKTPVQYLEYVRMRMAKALLNSTNMPILSIALSVGYGSISSFNRTFKKEFGHTPTEYRCLIQQ